MTTNEKIIILDYDPKWAHEFEALKKVLSDHLDSKILSIEHVGSTSIPDMKAKPVIDIDIIIEHDENTMTQVIQELSKLGYTHRGNLGITGREAFKRKDAKTPNIGSGKIWPKHHLYLCTQGSIGLSNHLQLRDYLLAHPQKVIEYGSLKQRLADEFPHDIDAYIDGKTEFIVEILRITGMKDSDANQISGENKISSD